jgi:hypothetical protein
MLMDARVLTCLFGRLFSRTDCFVEKRKKARKNRIDIIGF